MSDLSFRLTFELHEGKPALVLETPPGFDITNTEHVAALDESNYVMYARVISAMDGFGKPFAEIQERLVCRAMQPAGCGETAAFVIPAGELKGDSE